MNNILNSIYSNRQNNITDTNLWKMLLYDLNTGNEQKLFISFIENSLAMHPDNELTLDILDYVVDNGGYQIILEISSKEFLNIFANYAFEGSQAPNHIKAKILYLISKWGNRFNLNMNNPFPTFIDLYNFLLSQGISFPDNMQSSYYQYTDANYIKYKQEAQGHDIDQSQSQLQGGNDSDKLTKVSNITNLWIKKLIEINQIIDEGKYGINYPKLKKEMNDLLQWKERVNKMIGEYYEQTNIREIFINLKRDIEFTTSRFEKLLNNEPLIPYVSSFKQFNDNFSQNNSQSNFYSYYAFDTFNKGDFHAKKYPFNNPKLDNEHIKKEFQDLGVKIKKPFDKMGKDMNEKFGKIKDQWDSYDPNSKMNAEKENKHGYFDNGGHLHAHKPFLVKMKNGFNDIKKAFDKIGKNK